MDLRTLLFADFLVQVCCALGLLLMSRSVAGLRGLRWFAWAYAAATAGLVLVVLRPGSPAIAALFLGRLLVVLGAVLMTQGIAEFSVPNSSVIGWGGCLLGVFVPVELYCLWVSAQTAVLAFAVAFGAQLLVGVFLLLAHREPGERTVSRTMAGLLAGVGCLCLARAFVVPVRGGAGVVVAHPELLRFSAAALYLVFTASMAFGFVWMMTARMRNQLEQLARTDALTGVLNRRALEAGVQRELAGCQRRQAPLAVLAVDLDHFKFLNDAYGHAAGDAALAAAARLLLQCLRSSDLLARFGGEEFVAVLPDRDGVRASLVAERLRSRLEELRVDYEGHPLALTASFGIAVTTSGDTWNSVLRRADRALYAAKRAGRNCIRGESAVIGRSSDSRTSSRTAGASASI
ncbi:MAG: GGDEF domain-containing protein [Terriglobales bacterium]